MKQKIRCANPSCRRLFLQDPRVKNQRYCGRKPCQNLRKNLWQKEKMATDPDYQANQRDCLRVWRKRNPDYWRQYRSQHPGYVIRNRLLQKNRDKNRRFKDLAKMDASKRTSFVKAGSYYLTPAKGNLAKMDALSEKVFLIPSSYTDLAKKDSIDFTRTFP